MAYSTKLNDRYADKQYEASHGVTNNFNAGGNVSNAYVKKSDRTTDKGWSSSGGGSYSSGVTTYNRLQEQAKALAEAQAKAKAQEQAKALAEAQAKAKAQEIADANYVGSGIKSIQDSLTPTTTAKLDESVGTSFWDNVKNLFSSKDTATSGANTAGTNTLYNMDNVVNQLQQKALKGKALAATNNDEDNDIQIGDLSLVKNPNTNQYEVQTKTITSDDVLKDLSYAKNGLSVLNDIAKAAYNTVISPITGNTIPLTRLNNANSTNTTTEAAKASVPKTQSTMGNYPERINNSTGTALSAEELAARNFEDISKNYLAIQNQSGTDVADASNAGQKLNNWYDASTGTYNVKGSDGTTYAFTQPTVGTTAEAETPASTPASGDDSSSYASDSSGMGYSLEDALATTRQAINDQLTSMYGEVPTLASVLNTYNDYFNSTGALVDQTNNDLLNQLYDSQGSTMANLAKVLRSNRQSGLTSGANTGATAAANALSTQSIANEQATAQQTAWNNILSNLLTYRQKQNDIPGNAYNTINSLSNALIEALGNTAGYDLYGDIAAYRNNT